MRAIFALRDDNVRERIENAFFAFSIDIPNDVIAAALSFFFPFFFLSPKLIKSNCFLLLRLDDPRL